MDGRPIRRASAALLLLAALAAGGASAQAPGLRLQSNVASIRPGERLTLTLTPPAGVAARTVDVYLGVQPPGGAEIFLLTPAGPVALARAAPFLANRTLGAGPMSLLDLTALPAIPPGTYTLFALVVPAGTDPRDPAAPLGGVASTQVTVVTGAPVSFARDVQPIFTRNCAFSGWHARPFEQEGLVLQVGEARANIVRVASTQVPSLSRVAPSDPDNSYLVRKLMGIGITGRAMPFGCDPAAGTCLSAADLALIAAWIRDGAPDN